MCVQCVNNSQDISGSTLAFIKEHPLMADKVNPAGGQPLYYSMEFAFTKMNVDYVSDYTVFYLYASGMLTCLVFCCINMCISCVQLKPLHVYGFTVFLEVNMIQ